MSKLALGRLAMLALAAGLVAATPAAAHHAMDGQVPATFMQGLLSGLGHPVIGPDHLAFLVAIGIAAAIVPAGIGVIGAFMAASAVGVLAHVGAVTVPLNETLVAGSVVVAGALVALGSRGGALWLALAVLAGLVHGYAFGEAIVGADRGVLGAYLVGLSIASTAVAAGVMGLTRAFGKAGETSSLPIRTLGVAVGAVGVVMLAAGLG